MSERQIVFDQPEVRDEQAEAVRQATERAERAEQELAKLKRSQTASPESTLSHSSDTTESIPAKGFEELRADPMMVHLISALEAGKDIGHYGRLTFCMIARHFASRKEIVDLLAKDQDFSAEAAESLLAQVESHGYNPPRRERILEWQAEQEFPIIPNDDPDCGNVYRTLKFPDGVYKHIEEYQVDKSRHSAQ